MALPARFVKYDRMIDHLVEELLHEAIAEAAETERPDRASHRSGLDSTRQTDQQHGEYCAGAEPPASK